MAFWPTVTQPPSPLMQSDKLSRCRVKLSQLSPVYFLLSRWWWEIWRREWTQEWRQHTERWGGNGFGQLQHRPLWSLKEQNGVRHSSFPLACFHFKVAAGNSVIQPKLLKPAHVCSQTHGLLIPDAHTQKHATFPAVQGHRVIILSQNSSQYLLLKSRGCCLIYRSCIWVCACRAFAYLLCHPAGSQPWAQRSGTMHLPFWRWAEYLLQTFGPSITLVKLWCSLWGIYWSVPPSELKVVIWPNTVKKELLLIRLASESWYQFVFLRGRPRRMSPISARFHKFRNGDRKSVV